MILMVRSDGIVFKILDNEPIAWVRNESTSIDYEICVVRASYAQAVHGIGIENNLSPREKYQRQQKTEGKW